MLLALFVLVMLVSVTSFKRSLFPRRVLLSSVLSLSTAPVDPKVEAVRRHMRQSGIDAWIIPTNDPHMSEYTAPYYNRRAFISGFTGSAGTAVITHNASLLFTDGRYHAQAEMELKASWTLMKSGMPGVPTPVEYLAEALPAHSSVGFDPLVHNAEDTLKMHAVFDKKHLHLKACSEHPVDAVWGERPALPCGQLREHPLAYAGKSREEKMIDVRKAMAEQSADMLVIGALDEIMWLYNIRGVDVPCNPVSIAYAVLCTDTAHLFIDSVKVPAHISDALQAAGIRLHPYAAMLPFLENQAHSGQGKVWMDPKTTNTAVFEVIPADRREIKASPIVAMKAIKNACEVQHMRLCHERDGAAVVSFLHKLEQHLLTANITEVELDRMLLASRREYGGELFLEPSFDTIAGVNGNGAIIHYRAEASTCATLTKSDMLLLDSGGQYVDGTTDVTRTTHFGTPSDHQRDMFTRVLKGHIALSRAVFPAGTPGCLLDTLARQFLWQGGRDYLHGTGHGVGAALNVHEGPHRISPHLDNPNGLQKHMVVSNEPGYYEADKFGIRIENLMLAVDAELPAYAGKRFLRFDALTLIPIQKKQIKMELLSSEDREYVNAYHKMVRLRISPLLKSHEERTWLYDATAPLFEG